MTLTAPPEPQPRQDTDEEILVYEAEPVSALDGLGKFDLGSVPASVTPPKTWRKAAWFATISSGGVVVALLFAGSVLVSHPTETATQAINGWTERGGQPPTLEGEQYADPSTTPDSGTSTAGTSPPPGVSPGPTAGPGNLRRIVPGSSPDRSSPVQSSATGTTTVVVTESPTTPTTTPAPEKPPVTPAKRETNSPKHVLTYDPEVMADNSERFLNTVTEDPAAAHEVTTGELEEEGPEGLERKYQDVAYYEVKKISIDPNRGQTVNTVEVTYPDGSKKTEQRVLQFGEDTKIENDGKSPAA